MPARPIRAERKSVRLDAAGLGDLRLAGRRSHGRRLMPDRPGAPPRAWQRMLSGRRLDLLDPSPLDVEIEDIAHGLARVARWNGQTLGDHAFSVAQHSLLVERIFCLQNAGASAARAARDAAARRARIRDRRHDLALQGGARRRLPPGGSAPPRCGAPALRSARPLRCSRPAHQEGRPDGRLFRGRRAGGFFRRRSGDASSGDPTASAREAVAGMLEPWPPKQAEARFLKQFRALAANDPRQAAASTRRPNRRYRSA